MEPVGDFTELVRPGASLWVRAGDDSPARPATVESVRENGTHVLVKFENCGGRNAALAFSGSDLLIDEAQIVRPSDDFLFDDEVGGFSCVSREGESLGVATGIERLGPSRFLVVERGEKSSLVPYVYPIVVEVVRAERRLVLDPPEGLLDL